MAITALFKQSRDSRTLRGLPLPFPAPLPSRIFGEKPLKAALTPVLPTVCAAQPQQHAGVHVALGPAPAIPAHFPWISCRIHSSAPRGAAHPQTRKNSALSMGRAPKLQLENLAVDTEQSPVPGLRTKNASFPAHHPTSQGFEPCQTPVFVPAFGKQEMATKACARQKEEFQ